MGVVEAVVVEELEKVLDEGQVVRFRVEEAELFPHAIKVGGLENWREVLDGGIDKAEDFVFVRMKGRL